MFTRHQSLKSSLLLMILILPMIFPACNSGGSSHSARLSSDFVSAAPDESRSVYDNAASPDTNSGENNDEADDASREIEEADIIRIEDTRLYILNQYRGLFICDISTPDRPVIKGRLAVDGEPVDMYIRNGRAYVIVSLPQNFYYVFPAAGGGFGNSPAGSESRVLVVDVHDPAEPVIEKTVVLQGRVTDSRLVGDILYVVSSDDYYDGWVVDVSRDITAGGDTAGTYVASIDISNPAQANEIDREMLPGATTDIHVTDAAIFVPSTEGYFYDNKTTISYVDISDPDGIIRVRGDISIPGMVEDRFKMDYADGYFRICAYEWDQTGGKSSLRVIDVRDPDIMTEVGHVELGHGEQLFATRFDGDRAYMVTFEQVDPLWVIDLSDPENPRVTGELTVPGWATHIESRGERLIALGVDNTSGRQVSVSLFDVADPAAPALLDRVSFGDTDGWSSSTAYDDVKSLTIIDEMGLMLLPYTASVGAGTQSTYENRLQLIDFSDDDLRPRGRVTQEGDILRSQSRADRLFSISSRQLQVINAADRDNPTITAALPLMDNIVDFEPINSQYGVRVVQKESGIAVLQAVPTQNPEYGTVAGQVTLPDDATYTAMFIDNGRVYVVSTNWHFLEWAGGVYGYNYQGTSRITVYDFVDITRPVERGSLEIEGTYALTSRPEAYDLLHPYYSSQGECLRLDNNTLVFVKRPQGYDYPIVYGGVDDSSAGPMAENDETDDVAGAETLVLVVDLSDPDAPAVLSRTMLAFDPASGFFVNGNILYFSRFENLGNDAQGRPLVNYFLGRLDLSDPRTPAFRDGINIPGPCLGLSPDGDYGYTLDAAWTGAGENRTYTFNAVRIDADEALRLDTVDLGALNAWFYGFDYVLSGKRACFSGFGPSDGSRLVLKVIDIDMPGNLTAYDHAFENSDWVTLMDASETRIFLRSSGGVACYETFPPGNFVLDGYRSPGGWSNRVVFSNGRAYVPMGYYGLWVKTLR